jgi:hypothetical protein
MLVLIDFQVALMPAEQVEKSVASSMHHVCTAYIHLMHPVNAKSTRRCIEIPAFCKPAGLYSDFKFLTFPLQSVSQKKRVVEYRWEMNGLRFVFKNSKELDSHQPKVVKECGEK